MSTWSVSLDALVEKAKGDVDLVVRRVTFELFQKVVLRSPVDTGRFRANFNVSYGVADTSTTDSTTQARGTEQAQKALTLQAGGVVLLCNALPYARRLEYGWSKQAPQGMVRLSVQEFNDFVQKAVAAK